MTLYDQVRKSDPTQGAEAGTPDAADVGLFVQGGVLKQAALGDFPGGGGGGGAGTTQVPVRSTLVTMTANQVAPNLNVGDYIRLNQVDSSAGHTLTDYKVSIKAGAEAWFRFKGRTEYSGAATSSAMELYNVTAGTVVPSGDSVNLVSVPVTRSSNIATNNILVAKVAPSVDTEYAIRIAVADGLTSIVASETTLEIVEMPSAIGNVSNVVDSIEGISVSSIEFNGLSGSDLTIRGTVKGNATTATRYHIFVNGAEVAADYSVQLAIARDGVLSANEYASSYFGYLDPEASGRFGINLSIIDGKLIITTEWSGTTTGDIADYRSATIFYRGAVSMASISSIKIVSSSSSTTITPIVAQELNAEVIDPTVAQTGAPDLIKNTEYQVPGKWWQDPTNPADFYPVYRKSVAIGALPDTTTKSVAHGVTDVIEESVRVWGMATSGLNSLPLPYVNITSSLGIQVSYEQTNIDIKTGADRSTYTGQVVVEYSKSTDTPVTEAETVGNGGGSAITGPTSSITHGVAAFADTSGDVLEDLGVDADLTGYIGRAAIGFNGTNPDNATFSHRDSSSSIGYALMQTTAGSTVVNGTDYIFFRLVNVNQAWIEPGIFVGRSGLEFRSYRPDDARFGNYYTDNNGTHLESYGVTNDPLLLNARGSGQVRIQSGDVTRATIDSNGLTLAASGNDPLDIFTQMDNSWVPEGNGIILAGYGCTYGLLGKYVFLSGFITFPTTTNIMDAIIYGFPYPVVNSLASRGHISIGFQNNASSVPISALPTQNSSSFTIRSATTGAVLANSAFSGQTIYFGGFYRRS